LTLTQLKPSKDVD